MADIAERLLVLVPGAFVVIVTLVILLKHQKHQNDQWIKAHNETNEKYSETSKACSKVVAENTKMLGRVGGLVERRIEQVNGGK